MKRHDTDVVSLVFGLIFATIALAWPLWSLGAIDSDNLSWLFATAFVAIGVVGVTVSIMKGARHEPALVTAESVPETDDDLPTSADPLY